MKIEFLSLENFAEYTKVEVNFDDKITYLIGKNGSGKSTLGLNGVWFIFQGIAEKSSGGNNPLIGERFRFIGPNGASAKGKMILHDEEKDVKIIVSRKMTKYGTELSFEGPEGMELNQQWLNDLFNIFLIAPKKFMALSPKEQARALGINTDELDDRLIDLKQEYSSINAVFKAFGNIVELEEVLPVDFGELSKEKDAISQHNKEIDAQHKNIEEKKFTIDSMQAINAGCDNEIDKLKAQLREIELKKEENLIAMEIKIKALEGTPVPNEYKSFDDVQARIDNATDTNKKAAAYAEFVRTSNAKAARKKDLDQNKEKQEKVESDRIEYIKTFKFPFSNITVNDDGEILLGGKPINDTYFSTGEYLKIVPILIATTKPEMKYVFLQDFNLLDEEKQKDIQDYLLAKGFQLVIEMVGKEKLTDKNCILLRDNIIVESYEEISDDSKLII